MWPMCRWSLLTKLAAWSVALHTLIFCFSLQTMHQEESAGMCDAEPAVTYSRSTMAHQWFFTRVGCNQCKITVEKKYMHLHNWYLQSLCTQLTFGGKYYYCRQTQAVFFFFSKVIVFVLFHLKKTFLILSVEYVHYILILL